MTSYVLTRLVIIETMMLTNTVKIDDLFNAEIAKCSEFFFNHLKIVITTNRDPAIFVGFRTTGIDVHLLSIRNEFPNIGVVDRSVYSPTCGGEIVPSNPSTYLQLKSSEHDAQYKTP